MQTVSTCNFNCMFLVWVRINWKVDCVWNVMAHAQKPDFVFQRNGRVHLNRWGASVQSTTGSRGVRISDSNTGYTTFRGSVKSTCYSIHSPISPSLPLPVRQCVPSHFNWTLRHVERGGTCTQATTCSVLRSGIVLCFSSDSVSAVTTPSHFWYEDGVLSDVRTAGCMVCVLTVGVMSYCHISTFWEWKPCCELSVKNDP
jgi:hypothetical protein